MTSNQQTQLEAIYDHLMDGRSITQLEALEYFGCLRLSAIIYTLRKMGVSIETKRVAPQGYARYAVAN